MKKRNFNIQKTEGTTDVWLTPKWIIDLFGPFDLDPCAANPRPFDCAEINYTIEDNGLEQPWYPNWCYDMGLHRNGWLIYCNPPYSKAAPWIEKMIEHNNGILLIFTRTETKAVQRALKACSSVLFLDKRIKFLDSEGRERNNGNAPSMLIAFGEKAKNRLERGRERGIIFYNT